MGTKTIESRLDSIEQNLDTIMKILYLQMGKKDTASQVINDTLDKFSGVKK